ncbi:porin [Collimonas pratensis]|uniref:Outer membrane insertion C-terminal signal domain protein n=1 Tax=Collimonas pratensis TaxID=279113 RepID=A0A127Q710_9BURK|nr:porin [Collimonas pratensis]AMP05849.1 outer membrane insertion C-terminal signal domain protein [Collimonas pratensis]
MRKSVLKAKPLAVAAVLACAFAGQAQAQTNVTIYGRVDAGINYQSNQVQKNADGTFTRGGQWGVGGNEWGTSMIGFKGTEDLGGGLKALFTLESGFQADTGSFNGSGLFNRRSFVGLNGGFGTVKIGRDLALPSDRVWSIDPTGQQNMSTSTLFKGRNWPQTSNQIQYITPDTMGGFYVHAMYGAGEAAGSFTKGPTGSNIGSSTGLAVGFVQPTYELLAMYDTARDQNGSYDSLFSRSKEITVGGNVTFGPAKLFAGWQNISAPAQDTSLAPAGSMASANKANQFWLGANYQLTPALTLIGAAYHVKLNHDVGSANLFMVGTNYSLSKRTLLYASVGTIRNGSNTDFQVQTGDSTGLTGQNQSTFYTGISHSF